MYTIQEFDNSKTKVMNYIMYKKRTEYEVRQKFYNVIEENMLEDIIARNREDKQLGIAAHILLGNSKRARKMIDNLTEDQKRVFKEYPVYALLKD